MKARGLYQFFVVAASVLLTDCGGAGGGGGTPVAFPNGAKGHVVLQFEVQTTPTLYKQVKASVGAQLIADGESLDDADNAIAAAPVPLGGHWLRVGKLLVMADSQGNFVFPAGTVGTTVDLLRDPGDATPQASFRLTALDATGVSSNALVLHVLFGGPVQMSADGIVRTVASCCPPQTGKTRSLLQERCLDWDGPFGDHIPHPQASLQGLLGYIKSTCWKNVNSGLCYNEKNTIRNQVGGNPGPSCWDNHKYRMCQSIDETQFGFTDGDSGQVTAGMSDALQITNNTAENRTVVTLTGPGKLEDSKSGMSGQILTVNHYDDSLKQHLVERSIQYVSDPNVPSGTATITAESHGHTLAITLTISSTISIYPGSLNMGSGNLGSTFTQPFTLKAAVKSANLTMTVTGPNYESPPSVALNGVTLFSFQQFMPPPLSTGSWQTNFDGSHDYNTPFSISFPVHDLPAGPNTFTVNSGRPDDHYSVSNVSLTVTPQN